MVTAKTCSIAEACFCVVGAHSLAALETHHCRKLPKLSLVL